MPDLRAPRHIEPRLRGVQLPWMDVERRRRVATLRADDRGARETEGQHAQVAAARGGQVHAEAAQCRRGHLDQRARLAVDPVGIAAAGRIAVAAARDGEEAGVVRVALFDQDVQRPLEPRHDGKARRAEAGDLDAADLLQHVPAATDRVAELIGADRRHACVIPPVRREFVALVDDAAHQVRPALGDPAEHEERAARFVPIQQPQQAVHPHIDAALDRLPRRTRDVRLQRRDLEVLFHVHGEVMIELRAPLWCRRRGVDPALLDRLHVGIDLAAVVSIVASVVAAGATGGPGGVRCPVYRLTGWRTDRSDARNRAVASGDGVFLLRPGNGDAVAAGCDCGNSATLAQRTSVPR